MRLNIPARIREGISKVLALENDAFDGLVAVLENQSANVELIGSLPTSTNIPNVNPIDAEKIVNAVVSLHMLRSSRETPSGEFVNEVSQAVGAFDPSGQSEISKTRLLRIMDINALVVSAKAFTVLMDRERTMLTGKILTDLRYAFRSDLEQEPYGAVIIHTLKLSYHEEGDHKDFLIALDDDDIKTLRTVLERAESKARFLRKQLEAAHVSNLNIGRGGK